MSSCIRVFSAIFSTDVKPYQNLFQVPLQFTPTLSPGQHAACKTHSTHFCNFWAPEVPTFLWKGLCSWSGALIRKFIGTCKLRYFLKAVCTKWSLNRDPSRISAVGTIREQVDIFVIGSNRVQGEEWHSVREKDDDMYTSCMLSLAEGWWGFELKIKVGKSPKKGFKKSAQTKKYTSCVPSLAGGWWERKTRRTCLGNLGSLLDYLTFNALHPFRFSYIWCIW